MPLPQPIVVATRNPGKIREINEVLGPLGVHIVGLQEYPDLAEPAETGGTFAENARQKALYYASHTGRWCLADDSGLAVDALEGEPGVHSARYAADRVPGGSPRSAIDAANNERLLAELADVPPAERTARFVCHLALASPREIVAQAFDTIEGVIGYQPRGTNGFGYDPLFELPGRGCTSAELTSQAKNAISHRGKALSHLAGLMKAMAAG